MSPIVDNFFTKKSPYGYIIVLGTLGIFATLFYKNTNKRAQTHVSQTYVSQSHVSQTQEPKPEPVSQVKKEDTYRETLRSQSGRRGGKKSRTKTKKRK